MIYCHRGWVRVVYEGQGEPFVMYPGDRVIQPPEIRHRVLESSDGLEVVELGCPAEHETWVDHSWNCPTASMLRPELGMDRRSFDTKPKRRPGRIGDTQDSRLGTSV